MTKSEAALAKVQDLYMMQVHLWNVLDAKDLTSEERNEARKHLRTFQTLLRNADWRVMGGEDVYSELKEMQKQVTVKLSTLTRSPSKKPSVRARAVKKGGRSR